MPTESRAHLACIQFGAQESAWKSDEPGSKGRVVVEEGKESALVSLVSFLRWGLEDPCLPQQTVVNTDVGGAG